MYRDGVSDGQFDVVSELEIPQLKKAFQAISPDYKLVLILLNDN